MNRLPEPVSVHRAFIYAVCAPGMGEIYAGAFRRGVLSATIVLGFLLWFVWAALQLALWLFNGLARFSFEPVDRIAPHLLALGISLVGIYLIWLWGIFSATLVSAAARRRQGGAVQSSLAWGLGMAWLSPGTGHAYAGARGRGLLFFGLHLGAVFLLLLGYYRFGLVIQHLMQGGMLDFASNIPEMLELLKDMALELEYSPFLMPRRIITILALAETTLLLRNEWPGIMNRIRAAGQATGYPIMVGLGLAGMGWLCPGAGQILQGRDKSGWGFCGVYVGGLFLLAVLFKTGLISAGQLRSFHSIPLLVLLAAAIEAPARLVLILTHPPPPPLQ